MKYPTTIIDGFFDTPDLVKEFAINQQYAKNNEGRWPGARTDYLNVLSEKLSNETINKILPHAMGRDVINNDIEIQFEAYFHLIDKFSDDPNDNVNHGFIHRDEDYHFAGIIYLNEVCDKRCGTSIYKLKNELEFVPQDIKAPLYLHGEKVPHFDRDFTRYADQFEESISVDNRFNRLVMFDSQQWHGVTNFHTGTDEPRLTLVFFVKVLKNNYNRGNQWR